MSKPRAASISIGELGKKAGVSPDTLRHYEKNGVLPAPERSSNGYRLYPESALERVTLIRRALSVGFTLKELSRILGERDRGGAPCRGVRALAGEKLADVDRRLVELQAVREELHRLVEEWDARLSATPEGKRAGLLESLAGHAGKSVRNRKPLRPKADSGRTI